MANYEARFNKNGNLKVGKIWTWNKLAGSGVLNGCKGTCKNCTGCYNPDDPFNSPCYVFNSYRRFPSVIVAHVRNTNAMRNNMEKSFGEFALQIERAKNKPYVIRIHSSGEIESCEELLHWMDLAEKFPDVKFYIYTKEFDCLDAALKARNNQTPSNFFFNISIWHENGLLAYLKYKDLINMRAFVYDDGYDYKERLKYDCHCPAYVKTETGRVKLNHELTCDKCGICFSDKAKVCACLDH